jgi:predicted lipoprotein with Yx(FWY)xxD motif
MNHLIWPALLVAGLTLVACGGTSATGTTASPAVAPDITTASITVGGKSVSVLKTPKGLTLYYFTPDTAAKVACTGACATNWPPLIATADTPSASPTLPGKLTVLSGANGKQILYNGHPLYTFARDSAQADALGQGIGGKWFVATPDLAVAPSAAKYNY